MCESDVIIKPAKCKKCDGELIRGGRTPDLKSKYPKVWKCYECRLAYYPSDERGKWWVTIF